MMSDIIPCYWCQWYQPVEPTPVIENMELLEVPSHWCCCYCCNCRVLIPGQLSI